MLDEAFENVREAIELTDQPDVGMYNKMCYYCMTLVCHPQCYAPHRLRFWEALSIDLE